MPPDKHEWPIEEILCTVNFIPSGEWYLTDFGKYYSLIEKEYSNKEEMKILKQGIEKESDSLENGSCEEEILMRFSNNDGNRIIQLSRNTLIINLLPPYPGWEEFKPIILDRIADYISSFKPIKIKSLGIRYINRFTDPLQDFSLEKVFCINDYLPQIIFNKESPFVFQLIFENGDDVLTELRTGLVDAKEEEHTAVIFDIEVSSLESLPTKMDFLSTKLDEYHKRLNGIFKSCISERLKKIYLIDD